MSLKVRGVWTGPTEAGRTQAEVDAWAENLHRHGFTDVLPNLKAGHGLLFWPSKRFPEAVARGYQDFDLPAAMLEALTKRSMRLHAWFIDYYEGVNGQAFKSHPEWAATDWKGRPTTAMELRGQPYGAIWMCPARRPGYTDQWLVPCYEEFAEMYGVETIHHDYIRYPGDAAPDQYCFCDYCLENLPRWAGYISDKYPNEPFYHEKYDREFLEAHWEPSPRVLPANWDLLDRGSKSRFLLEGGFFQGGRNDLDYFFYRYRIERINEFAKLSHAAVKKANPKVGLSGAIFKNPIHSGRFIGQDWREFAQWMDVCIPMDYRDHFPGTFEQYLDLLEETIYKQKQWSEASAALWIGIAVNFLFKEEPNGPYPSEKLRRAIERIESTGVEGIVLFCESQLTEFGMWDQVRISFA